MTKLVIHPVEKKIHYQVHWTLMMVSTIINFVHTEIKNNTLVLIYNFN